MIVDGDAFLAKIGLYLSPERCLSGRKPLARVGDQTWGTPYPGTRVALRGRPLGSQGVILAERSILCILNPSVGAYKAKDSDYSVIVAALRSIAACDQSLPITYARPSEGASSSTYARCVHEAFAELPAHRGERMHRAENVWVLLHSPEPDPENPYIVLGRFRAHDYDGESLSLLPQLDVIADPAAFWNVRAYSRRRAACANPGDGVDLAREAPGAIERACERMERASPARAAGVKRARSS